MDIPRQQFVGPVLAIIESLRSTANMLEAQLQAFAPPSAQMPPMSMFQMYHPNPAALVPQQHAQQVQGPQQQPQQPNQHQQQMVPPQSGGAPVASRPAKREAEYDASGNPVKKRRRRRRRNSAGVLVDIEGHDNFLENGDHPSGGRRRGPNKAPVDPNRPKRPASAYLIFQNEVRKDMQAAYPDKPYHEILGKISERWNQLTDVEKKHYTDITVAQKVQYEKDKAKYEAERNGGVVPPSAGSTAPATSAGVAVGVPVSAGLAPSVDATPEDGEDDDDEEEASEASAVLHGQDDEDEDDDEDGEDE